eukprot:NODE_89_length_21781_cov_0.895836.p17 type:complete len:161 gc:universal NODE_89_length_21781_cov_0.895836:8479-8961(+)
MFFVTFSLASPIGDIICPKTGSTVCGGLNGKQKEYPNNCQANYAGATVFLRRNCLESKNNEIVCPLVTAKDSRTCGKVKNRPQLFDSLCLALKSKATIVKDDDCKTDPIDCHVKWGPVCGTLNGKRQTFQNNCNAEKQGAIKIKQGPCPLFMTKQQNIFK